MFKISDPDLLRRWKRVCIAHGNLFVGQTLPCDGAPIASTPVGDFEFSEINTPIDYLRFLERHRRAMIRSITIGLPLDALSTAEIDERVRPLLKAAGETLKRHEIAPRTSRFTLPPSGADGEVDGALLSRIALG